MGISIGDKRVAYTDSEKVIKDLDKQAKKEGRSRNNLLKKVVKEYLKR